MSPEKTHDAREAVGALATGLSRCLWIFGKCHKSVAAGLTIEWKGQFADRIDRKATVIYEMLLKVGSQ